MAKDKIQVVVLDITGTALEWLDTYGNEDHMEICEILTLGDDSPIPIWKLNEYDNWDILLVFENGVRERVDHIIDMIGIPGKPVLYPLDVEGSLRKNEEISSYIFSPYIKKLIDYASDRENGQKYAIVSASELTYINVSSDNVIIPEMMKTGENWAKDDMELFFKLASEYFVFNENQDIFCDVGANIGTTCIYFNRVLEKDIRILAFEPAKENYKLLRINAMLNDIDVSDHWFVPMGVSDKSQEAFINYNPLNPGGSSFVSGEAEDMENVSLVTFDDYLADNHIDPCRIKYIWVDVEGFEARFLAGARKTLEKINAPIFMEFIPRFYMDKEGEFELLMDELSLNFRSYICAQDPFHKKHPIEDLKNEKSNNAIAWDLFLLRD